MELLALTTRPPAAEAVAPLAARASLLEVYRAFPGRPPGAYAGAIRADGLDPGDLAPLADVALYTGSARHLRRRPVPGARLGVVPGIVVVFGVRARPGLDLAAYDAHWRDSHGPKALRHHVGMDDYVQWTVAGGAAPGAVGVGHDGFSLCGFATEDDLRTRFFDGPEGQAIISADAAAFVDLTRLDRVECELEILA